MANYSLPYAAQLACRDSNTTIPQPPFLANGSGAACAVSGFVTRSPVLLAMCCNTTLANANGVRPTKHNTYLHNILHPARTAGYEANGCSWRYCNVTGTEGVKGFEQCMESSGKIAKGVTAKCFIGKDGPGSSVIAAPIQTKQQTSGGDTIQWRSKKEKKTTVSAALLLALGVAGLVLGS